MDRAEATAASMIRVELAFSPRAGKVQRTALVLPEGATIGQALELAGVAVPDGGRVGVWGRLREATDTLRDRDHGPRRAREARSEGAPPGFVTRGDRTLHERATRPVEAGFLGTDRAPVRLAS